jgi:hypothetical protein
VAFARVEEQVVSLVTRRNYSREDSVGRLDNSGVASFLKIVQDEVSTGSGSAADRMVELDKAFHLTRSGNSRLHFSGC